MSVKIWTAMIGLATLGLSAGPLHADTISYQQGGTNALVAGYTGAQDAELSSQFPNSQFGIVNPYFRVGETGNQTQVLHGIMRWDLSSLAGLYSTINSVTITYFDDSSYEQPNINGGGEAFVYALNPANAGWVENDVTWNNQVQGGPTPWAGLGGASLAGTDYDPIPLADYMYVAAGPPIYKTITLTGHAGLTLTDLIDQWSGNQANNAGLLWRSNTEGSSYTYDYLHVNSKENATLENRPMLSIDYTPAAIPEPATLVLASCVGAFALLRNRRGG
jgi:hypothetical protein